MLPEEIAPRYPALEGGVGVGEPMNELEIVTRSNRAEIPPRMGSALVPSHFVIPCR